MEIINDGCRTRVNLDVEYLPSHETITFRSFFGVLNEITYDLKDTFSVYVCPRLVVEVHFQNKRMMEPMIERMHRANDVVDGIKPKSHYMFDFIDGDCMYRNCLMTSVEMLDDKYVFTLMCDFYECKTPNGFRYGGHYEIPNSYKGVVIEYVKSHGNKIFQ